MCPTASSSPACCWSYHSLCLRWVNWPGELTVWPGRPSDVSCAAGWRLKAEGSTPALAIPSAPLKMVVCPQCVWRWRKPRKEPSITRDSAARLRHGSLWRKAFMKSLCVSAWRRPRRSSLEIRWTRWRHMVHRCDDTVTDWTVTLHI